MSKRSKHQFLVLALALVMNGCAKQEPPNDHGNSTPGQPGTNSTPVQSAAESSPATSTEHAGFDINKVPVVQPQLGKFPYVSLIEGYRRREQGSKDVAFDQYEFFDGAKIIPVEGRLTTIEAEGQEASAHQVFKTYESLIKDLGGVTVFEGTGQDVSTAKVEFRDKRHRDPVYEGDEMGIYMVRTPDREIWVEGYVPQHYGREGTYFLTVVEKKLLDVKASLLPAEEMKKELDAKGHVALYINFDFDKADIKPDSKPIIDQIVKLLTTNPSLKLTVEGHTDNVGKPAYNQRLSEARAKSVVAALTAQGIDNRRLNAAGYGQTKPIADNGTDEGRAKNRRVELVKMTS
jgi:OmpA-OmpF porin, OOP family